MVARGRRSKSAETGDDSHVHVPDHLSSGRPSRRPLVEDLEGRLLLTGIQGRHIGTSVVSAIVGNHIGVSVSAAMIQGAHIGTNVA